MLRRLVRRWRMRHFPAPWQPPAATTWRDELARAGTDVDSWIVRRLSEPRTYAHVSDDRLRAARDRCRPIADATIAAAERVLRHEFDLLGSGPFTPRDPDRAAKADGYSPIDWALDPVSHLRFPCGFTLADWSFDRMRPGLADIKLPWELSRCQHWAPLGQAFRLTGDARFAVEIANELRDFMEANPVAVGVNWTCTMDVGLRAANWAIALELIRGCDALPSAFWRDAYEALFDHGVFIERNLEDKYGVTSNHFLSDVVGLFFVADVFRDLPRGALWDARCREWLEREMDTQVLPDGSDFESSLPYHRLVSELMMGAARIADVQRRPMPEPWRTRLRMMVEFLGAVGRPDGLLPQVGDADDGRLHIFTGYGSWRPQDARHLFGPAACLLGESAWWHLADRDVAEWEATWWGFDPSAIVCGEPAPAKSLQHFPSAGVTVMREAGDYVIITNGKVGTAGVGNHKHNDLLSFECHIDGQAVFVDAGSYVYTSDPEARNMFRSTAYHNTVSIDGEEQNELRLGREFLFRMFERAEPEHLSVTDRGDAIEYRGRHRGYARLSNPVIHEREVTYHRARGSLDVIDTLLGDGLHTVRWHFHLAPGVQVRDCGDGRFDVRAGTATIRFTAPRELQACVADAWYSPSYGVRVPCAAIGFTTSQRFEDAARYVFRIERQPA